MSKIDVTATSVDLKSKYIYNKTRVLEILDAMERYSYQRFPIPIEWIEELKELIK